MVSKYNTILKQNVLRGKFVSTIKGELMTLPTSASWMGRGYPSLPCSPPRELLPPLFRPKLRSCTCISVNISEAENMN